MVSYLSNGRGLIRLGQDSHQLQALHNVLMNPEFHMKSRIFLQVE